MIVLWIVKGFFIMSYFKYTAPLFVASTLICLATEQTHTASPAGSVVEMKVHEATHAASPAGSVVDMHTHEAAPTGSLTEMKVHEATHATSPEGSIAAPAK